MSAATHGDWVHAQFTQPFTATYSLPWPSPSSCAGCPPQRFHTALALGSGGRSEQPAEQQSSRPEGECAKSAGHQLVYACANNITKQYTLHINSTDNKRVVTLMIHTIKRFTQLKYKCPCLLCPCSRCVQRGHKTHLTSSKQCRPTLSMAFTSNPQDLTRYSTMDN